MSNKIFLSFSKTASASFFLFSSNFSASLIKSFVEIGILEEKTGFNRNRYYVFEEYIKITNRRVTFEYIMLENINDSEEHAIELSKLLKNLNCYVNETYNLSFEQYKPASSSLINYYLVEEVNTFLTVGTYEALANVQLIIDAFSKENEAEFKTIYENFVLK